MSGLLGLAEAQERLLALATPGTVAELPIEKALGHYLAQPLQALRTQPAHPLSAMDGWAVRKADMPGPWRVIGESAAGHPFTGTVGHGEAARISTGAILPDGADMVVVQEDCTREGDTLSFEGEPPHPLAKHIRREGIDFREGKPVLAQGAPITPRSLALAISAGHGTVPVHPRPRVVVIDSGDELVPAGQPLGPGQIPVSNGPMLTAMLAALPCQVTRIGPVADRMDDLVAALASAADADLVITSGGASVGDHDLVRPALERIGAQIDFWRVAIKPGKPIMVAQRDRTLFLGLPGNPVSAFVTATLFALPLVRRMLGAVGPLPSPHRGQCAAPLPGTGKRAEFLRARLVDGMLEVLNLQDSGALSPLAIADALIVRAAHAEPTMAGETVEFIHI